MKSDQAVENHLIKINIQSYWKLNEVSGLEDDGGQAEISPFSPSITMISESVNSPPLISSVNSPIVFFISGYLLAGQTRQPQPAAANATHKLRTRPDLVVPQSLHLLLIGRLGHLEDQRGLSKPEVLRGHVAVQEDVDAWNETQEVKVVGALCNRRHAVRGGVENAPSRTLKGMVTTP